MKLEVVSIPVEVAQTIPELMLKLQKQNEGIQVTFTEAEHLILKQFSQTIETESDEGQELLKDMTEQKEFLKTKKSNTLDFAKETLNRLLDGVLDENKNVTTDDIRHIVKDTLNEVMETQGMLPMSMIGLDAHNTLDTTLTEIFKERGMLDSKGQKQVKPEPTTTKKEDEKQKLVEDVASENKIYKDAEVDVQKGWEYLKSLENVRLIDVGLLNPIPINDKLVVPMFMLKMFSVMNIRNAQVYVALDEVIKQHTQKAMFQQDLGNFEPTALLHMLGFSITKVEAESVETSVPLDEVLNHFFATTPNPDVIKLKQFLSIESNIYGKTTGTFEKPLNSIDLGHGYFLDFNKVSEFLKGK